MIWIGEKIKTISKTKNIKLIDLAKNIGVSRQTINDWIKGQIPKGNHLINLCDILEINPKVFFENNIKKEISIPLHRTKGTAKINKSVQDEAIMLAQEYKLLFKNIDKTDLIPVIRIDNLNNLNAINLSKKLRNLLNLDDKTTINFEQTFKLLNIFQIYLVFKKFPKSIKTYAFYTKIFNNRVVFVNNQINIIDLIFPLLHEAIHSILDESFNENEYKENEEIFCDKVAQYIQFPKPYVKMVYELIKDLPVSIQVNKLKEFSETYKHSLFGIVKSIEAIDKDFNINIGGAN